MSKLRKAAERHVTTRCPQMARHRGSESLPQPCGECYSVESVWRRIPWEPPSRTPVFASLDWEPR